MLDSRWIAAGLAALVAVVPAVADACTVFGIEELIPDTSLDDDVPPGAVGEVDVTVRRGHAPVCRFGSCASDSCDDTGAVELEFDVPRDDHTGLAQLGYRIEIVDGEAPDGLVPDFAFQTALPGSISLVWADGATDDQEKLDLTIVVYAIDEAGNESEASPEIAIFDPGSHAGCSVGGHPDAAPWLLALPLLAFTARRRERARRA